MRRTVNGILLLDKPLGISSNQALQRIKRLFNAKKAGHTGSLDPLATGMLPICFGEAAKFSQFLLDADKSYFVTAKLGERTSTGDKEGEIIETCPVPDITEEQLKKTLAQFLGELEQTPPMFSAVKVQGKPLYQLARRGIQVERKPRKIRIHSLNLENIHPPEFSFHVHCSKGTYVRVLVEDIGDVLKCGAHVTELRRTMVHPYNRLKMYTVLELENILNQSGMEGLDNCLLPIETSVQGFLSLTLSAQDIFYLRTGRTIQPASFLPDVLVKLVSEDGKFLGMGETLPDGRIKIRRFLSCIEERTT